MTAPPPLAREKSGCERCSEAEPAGGEARVALRLFRATSGVGSRASDRHAADLPRGHLGENEVAMLHRLAKDVRGCPLELLRPCTDNGRPPFFGGQLSRFEPGR